MDTYRIDLYSHEFELFKEYIKIDEIKKAYELTKDDKDSENIFEKFLNKINNPKIIKHSNKKITAIQKATQIRSSNAKEKINNAINILRLENKQFTHYNISKTSKVAFQTVKKYINKELLEKLNQNELNKVY